MEDWLRQHELTLKTEHAWLGKDFVEFLKERGLLSSEPIPPDLESILAGFARAQDALGRLQLLVDERLEGDPNHPRWQRPTDQPSLSAHLARGSWKWPLEYWSAFEPTPRERYRDCYFEWGLRGWHTQPAEPPSFYAGVSCWNDDRGDPLKDPSLRERAAQIARERGLRESFGEPGKFTDVTSEYALYQQLPLTALQACDSLDQQAERIANFINLTFEVLRDAGRLIPASKRAR